MSRSTFYVYFEDKGALLLALEAASMRSFYDGAREWIDHGPGVVYADVEAGMRKVLERFREDAGIMQAVAETAVYDPAVRDQYTAAVDDYIRRVERLIKQGRRTGDVRDVVPRGAATALGWMLERTCQQTAPGASDARLAEVARGLADVVWATLYATR
jgi:TetR/AcrR family transcriptional regulator, ethionamide resistance regulator